MSRTSSLPALIESFFTERLMRQQHVSGHTIASYRDTFRLLLAFASHRRKTSPSELELRDLDAPFIVEFLYAYSFTKRPNMKELIDHGIIRDVSSAPQGFEPLTKDQFRTILRLAQADPRSFVH